LKSLASIDIPGRENVNLPEKEVCLADALALDDRTIMALVDLIFSQQDPDAPVS